MAIWRNARTVHRTDGPYLFGRFTIADAMYAPMVSRFVTYGIEGDDAMTQAYMDAIIADPDMKQWYDDAAREDHQIEHCEVGL
ncbi:MAG: glutathione S-transferase C-terminal domain-containing protein [Pseudomonadota bacterium]